MIYYDFTSTANWGGNAVGIIRVERELLRALLKVFPSLPITPVMFHNQLKQFVVLRRDVLAAVMESRAVVGMDAEIDADVAARVQQVFSEPSDLSGVWPLLQELAEKAQSRIDACKNDLQEDWRRHYVLDKEGNRRFWVPFYNAVSDVATPGKGDVVISLGLDWDNKDLRAIYQLKKELEFEYVQYIYDVVPVRFPQYVVPALRSKISNFFEEIVWIADRFVCISETTRKDWVKWHTEFMGHPPEALAAPISPDLAGRANGSAADALVQEVQGFKYALYVSTIEPRKNHRTAYLAWKRALEEGRLDPAQHRLVFLGMKGWCSGDLVKEISTDRSLCKSIVLLSDLNDAQLIALYRNCEFSIFPSHYEGFGLGLGEALSFGKRALSSTTGSLPEVGGEHAEYLDPDDTLGWSRRIAELMSAEAPKQPASPYPIKTWSEVAIDLVESGVLR